MMLRWRSSSTNTPVIHPFKKPAEHKKEAENFCWSLSGLKGMKAFLKLSNEMCSFIELEGKWLDLETQRL